MTRKDGVGDGGIDRSGSDCGIGTSEDEKDSENQALE